MLFEILNLQDVATLPCSTMYLSEAEQHRLTLIKRSQRLQQFIAGRQLARFLLQRTNPNHTFNLSAEPDQPVLVEGYPHLHLTLSHSKNWVACAIAEFEIGIDIETIIPSRPTDEIAKWICSKQELAILANQDTTDARLNIFFEFWSLKEAWFKQQTSHIGFNKLTEINFIPATKETATASSWVDLEKKISVAIVGSKAIGNSLTRQSPSTHYWQFYHCASY